MSSCPKVSLVIPVYNGEKYLVPCLESALGQTYENLEIIAVNDGSTDGTARILERYSDRIRVVDRQNGGEAAAHNTGIDNMTGEWLAVLGSDDIMYPDAIEQMVLAGERLGSSSSTKIIPFFDFQIIGADGSPKGRIQPHHMDNSMSALEQGVAMLDEFFANHGVSIIHKSILADVDRLDEGLDRCEDLEFNIRLTWIHKYRFHHIPKIIYGYRVHDGQTRPSIEDRYHTRRRMWENVTSALSREDMEKIRAIKRKTSVIRVCRDAERLLGSFAYGKHGNAAARLAAKTLRAAFASSILRRITYALAYRMRTAKISSCHHPPPGIAASLEGERPVAHRRAEADR